MKTGSPATTAMIFPGIGPSSFKEVAKFLLLNPAARPLVAEADETLGYSLVDRYREAESAGQGEYTEYSRMAFLVTCLALAAWASENYGLEPEYCAGPSFGGTPAAVFSGALDFGKAVWLTAEWGRHVDAYFARENGDIVTQSFARTPPDRLREVLAELDERGEWYDMAAYVDEDFSMLSVRESSVEWLQQRLRAAGGLPLYVMRPPMHSRAFAPLRDTLQSQVFARVHFRDCEIPVVSDHDGTVLRSADEIRTLILDASVRPVRWPDALATLKERGVRRVCVAGQDALWGRVAAVTRNFEVLAAKPETALRPRRRGAAA
jgi:[acyl-carrier-protein] S-malonyltransferase